MSLKTDLRIKFRRLNNSTSPSTYFVLKHLILTMYLKLNFLVLGEDNGLKESTIEDRIVWVFMLDGTTGLTTKVGVCMIRS